LRNAILAALVVGGASGAVAQDQPRDVLVEESVFVEQAPDDRSSSVYFPDEITPESVAAARAEAARREAEEAHRQEQLRRAGRDGSLAQVTARGDTGSDVDQLSDGQSAQALAQLTEAERQVLLEAVEGTDICERASSIPAIKALCESRLETRAAEFTRPVGETAEDRLLGGSLDAERVATLEAAVKRLAGAGPDANDFSNQVLASVALGNQTLSDAQSTAAADGDPASDLSPETQALINSIVQQFGGGN
jgi:hypothetical protein